MDPDPAPARPHAHWSLLSRYLKPHGRAMAVLAVLILVDIGLQLINPQIMKRFIDAAQSREPLSVLTTAATLFIAVAVAQQLLSVASTYVRENVAWKTTNALRRDLARHCVSLDLEFHDAHSPGEMIERIDGDVSTLSTVLSEFAAQAIGNAILLAGIIALMLATDLRVGLPMALIMSGSVLAIVRLQSIGSSMWEKSRQASADLFGYLEERLAGTEDIRSLGAREYVLRGFYRCSRALVTTTTRAGTLGAGVAHNSSFLLSQIGTAVALAIGAYLYLSGRITTGTVYILYHYAVMASRPIGSLAHQMQDLQQAGAGIARVSGLFALSSRVADPLSPRTVPRNVKLGVAFSGVSFAYDRGSVLRDLSFSLAPGRVMGLLGRSGSGKSTVTRLIYRLYDPGAGSIRLLDGGEGYDLRDLGLRDLRCRIGMVTQNVQLYQATLKDNIAFFDPHASDDRIRDVLARLGLEPWVARLPEGVDTRIRESSLSAGEAQLVAFARVFLRDPAIVILDEASSRLDPATELLVERAVDELLRGRTALVIAHRLRTVHRADDILILADGACVEQGPREDLAANKESLFARLLDKDSGGLLAEEPV